MRFGRGGTSSDFLASFASRLLEYQPVIVWCDCGSRDGRRSFLVERSATVMLTDSLVKTILLVFVLFASLAYGDETNLTLTIDGVTSRNVRFGRTTPAEVSIFHATGVATVPLEKLPRELQKRFGYDPQEAAEYRAAQQAAQHRAASSPSRLPEKGAFVLFEKDAHVLCDQPSLRFSVWNNDEYLLAQAVLWNDSDPSLGTNASGREIGDRSTLMVDVDANRQATPNVDRSYSLNPWPSLPGLRYQICVRGTDLDHLQVGFSRSRRHPLRGNLSRKTSAG